MKKILIVYLLISLFNLSTIGAQKYDAVLKREVGIRMPGLTNFDFIYKKPRGGNKFKRLRIIYTDISVYDLEDVSGSFSFGLTYGWEKRKPLKDQLSLIRGWEIIGGVGGRIRNDVVDWSFTPGIGFVLGFQYDLNENFVVNLEIIPSLRSRITEYNDEIDVSNLSLNMNTNDVALGFLYRF